MKNPSEYAPSLHGLAECAHAAGRLATRIARRPRSPRAKQDAKHLAAHLARIECILQQPQHLAEISDYMLRSEQFIEAHPSEVRTALGAVDALLTEEVLILKNTGYDRADVLKAYKAFTNTLIAKLAPPRDTTPHAVMQRLRDWSGSLTQIVAPASKGSRRWRNKQVKYGPGGRTTRTHAAFLGLALLAKNTRPPAYVTQLWFSHWLGSGAVRGAA